LKKLKSIYDFYTAELTYFEIEKLIRREAPGVLDFYLSSMKKPDNSKNFITRGWLFFRNLFIAFLLKLTPLRRILYTLILFFFLYGYWIGSWNWAFITFCLLNLLLAFEVADKLTAKSELELARQIQESLIPKSPPQIEDIDIACYSESAKEVGGDYLDFITSNEKTHIIIGDISGKGMAAAIYMVQVRAILHHLIDTCSNLKEILSVLNRNLYRIFRRDYFFTANIAELNGNKELKLCRAGHQPALHFSFEKKRCDFLIPRGMGLGLTDKSIFDTSMQEETVKLEPGDVVVFYTDGLTETMNEFKIEFGEDRLKNIICSSAGKTALQIQSRILMEVNRFNNLNPDDDLSIIVIKAI